MSAILQLLQSVFGSTSSLFTWGLIALALLIYVFLSERAKELLERLWRPRSPKKEIEQLKNDVVKAFRREDDAKERAERFRALAESSLIERNAALWKITGLEREIVALRRQLATAQSETNDSGV